MEPLLRRADADRLGPAVVAGRMEQVEGVADARKMEPMEQVLVGKKERSETVAGMKELTGPAVAGMKEPLERVAVGMKEQRCAKINLTAVNGKLTR